VVNWINGQNATNMAAKLSSHLAAMVLNVRHGFVPRCAMLYDGEGFMTVEELIDLAADALCADGFTPPGNPHRTLQEGLAQTLDDANNDLNYTDTPLCEDRGGDTGPGLSGGKLRAITMD
jgi:hypothetical protein